MEKKNEYHWGQFTIKDLKEELNIKWREKEGKTK